MAAEEKNEDMVKHDQEPEDLEGNSNTYKTNNEGADASSHGEEEQKSDHVSQLESEVSELKQQLEVKSSQVENLEDRLLRLQADFDNLKKRSLKEKTEIKQRASCELIEKLLPVLDNFERAIEADPGEGTDSFREGVEMIYSQLQQVLKEEGLECIEALGKEFDPNKHEAVMKEESDEEENVITEEVRKGYIVGNKVIRPSMVKVASK